MVMATQEHAKYVLKSKTEKMNIKIYLYLLISVNLVLWNAEIWSGNIANLKLLDIFHHKVIWRILYITIKRVRDEYITNNDVR